MIKLEDVDPYIRSVLNGGDILFIVPPFSTTESPVLGVHILQTLAEEMGFKTEILYLNVCLAAVIGIEHSEYIGFPPMERMWMMLHERLFARSAFGLPPLGKNPEYCMDEAMSVAGNKAYPEMIYKSGEFDFDLFIEIETICTEFVENAVPAIVSQDYEMIGCSSRMGQTNCSVALLDRIKKRKPDTVTLIGGADCKGVQARGIASLTDSIDYIFSGESDLSFSDFLGNYRKGIRPLDRIIQGEPVQNLDTLPFTDFSSFLNQNHLLFSRDAKQTSTVCYETSRGCWWGEKNRCRFCSEDNICRQKSAKKVISDLERLSADPRIEGIYMCDVAMPLSYHEDVFPKLPENEGFPHIYYQSKVNVSLQDLINLKKKRISQFTFGIEALSTGLLKTMNKGSTARLNLRLLRYARSVGILIDWLFLWGFPMDKEEDYQETLALLPLISHLHPPVSCLQVILGRWSPYFEQAENFNIKNVRPMAVYHMIFPERADLDSLASWFMADYPSAARENPELMKKIGNEIGIWKAVWERTYLTLVPVGNAYLVLDNRECTGKKQHVLDESKAREVMIEGVYTESEYQQWALEEKLGVLVDSRYVPLVTSSPDILHRFESE